VLHKGGIHVYSKPVSAWLSALIVIEISLICRLWPCKSQKAAAG
jgi:hypothetical protein